MYKIHCLFVTIYSHILSDHVQVHIFMIKILFAVLFYKIYILVEDFFCFENYSQNVTEMDTFRTVYMKTFIFVTCQIKCKYIFLMIRKVFTILFYKIYIPTHYFFYE